MSYSAITMPRSLRYAGKALSCIYLCALSVCFLSGCQLLNRTSSAGDISGLKREAALAWARISSEPHGTKGMEESVNSYNQAIAKIVKNQSLWDRIEGEDRTGVYTIGFNEKGVFVPPASGAAVGTIKIGDFTACRIASEVKLQGFDRVVGREGIGVPVILTQDDPLRVTRPFQPPKGEFIAATAILEFPNHGAKGRLKFYDPAAVTEVKVGARTLPLAANLTAPMQFTLTDSTQDEDDTQNLPPSASGEEESQLFFLTPYDRTKVPVVFVHGLRSGPVIWKNAINELLADPELRRRFQPVVFVYPSGLPIPTSAARLRQLLKEARKKLDSNHHNVGFSNIVIVGHSMGGLVARMQVIDAKRDFWKAFYTASPQTITSKIDPEAARVVRASLLFDRLPYVKTVVFITTPHRGSELADVDLLQRVGQVLVALPESARKRFRPLKELPETVIHPALRTFNEWGTSGVENLSTKHTYFEALAKRPIRVPFHSIIGVGDAVNPMDGTDGVVPYWSAHLKGAASETVVPYPHGCVERSGTVSAIMKVLKEIR